MSLPNYRYHEQRHGGMEVLAPDGLMPYAPAPGLEVVQDVRDREKPPLPAGTIVDEPPLEKNNLGALGGQMNRAEEKPRVSRRCLWILIAVLVVLVVAAVGGAVGGTAASHKSSTPTSESSPHSTISQADQSFTASSGQHSTSSPQHQPSTSSPVPQPSTSSSAPQPATSSLEPQSSTGTSASQPSTSTASSSANTVYWGNDIGVNIGCYIDKSNRMLTGPNFTDASSMTPQLCAGLCSTYTYFGLEDASQCFCGNTLTSGYSETSSSDCDATCTGNSNEVCGNVWRIDVYQLTAANPPVKSYNSLGCYNDGTPRILQGPEYQNAWVTPQLCAGLCNDYTYFGVEYGEQCFCDNGYNSTYTQAADSKCNYPCVGDTSQTCGGYYAIDLYSFG